VREIGRYELHHELASGGMATVYLGRLKGAVGFARTVAIKQLHPQFAKQPEFTTMFIDEARIAARLAHPNIVATLDVVAESGELSLVMEYVEGESLDRLIKAGGQAPLPIVSAIVSGLLEGLHAAHEAKSERGESLNVVHRDVSPQNVLVGVDGVARVLDFGIAKAADRLQTTQDGGLKGKVAYMAPEQLRLESVDRRTDVYAAGVVLWEALTGRRMFRATNPVSALSELLASVPEPPSTANPNVSSELDAVVKTAIARDPAHRFSSAREFARALETAVPAASPRDVGSWVTRLARDALGQRGTLVSAMQGQTQVTAAPAVPAPPDPGGTEAPVTNRTPPRPERRRIGYALAAVLGAVVAGAVVFVLGKSNDAALVPLPAMSSTPSPELPAAPLPSSSSVTPTASVSATAPKPVVQRKLEAPAKPRKNCNPPYVVDTAGIKTYKPGCLR
jgi:eukaryotic-like serine/threonine-protein kinase